MTGPDAVVWNTPSAPACAMPLDQLVPVLQLAIGPVILISGAGLILLSMTNRYGRVIDRARSLAEVLRTSGRTDPHRFREQCAILLRRARLIRLSIALTGVSLLLAAVLVISLFLAALLGFAGGAWIVFLFVACLGALIAGLGVFLVDVNVSLAALTLEMDLGEAE